jgi:DNA invertase Pin-like site-specific DNA recombinase/transcription elongation factor Elf1
MQITDNKIKKALAYCRVSSQEQTEGYSLDTQEKFCRKFADDNGYKMVEVYRDEGKSGTSLNRPALQDLLAKCQEDKDINAVVVQETDRLARNTKDHLTIRAMLKKAGIKLISVAQPMLDDSPEGNMIDTILASVNQFQSDINSRKTKKGLQERFDSGWLPGWSPLGFIKKELENGKSIVVPDPEKWNLVKQAFKMYLTGNYSVVQITEKFFKQGLRSKTGVKVPYSIMTDTLRNPFYAGLMRWNGQEKMGKHKPMITLEEHRQILTIMDAHNYHACRRRKHNFLLRGFVFCDICGQRFTADRHRANKISDYYHCSARSIEHSNKDQNVETDNLEEQVEGAFKNIQFSREFINLVIQKVKTFYQEKRKESESQKRILLNKKSNFEEKRKVAEEKLMDGTLPDEDFVRVRGRYKNELDNLQGTIAELENKHEIDVDTAREVLMLSRNIYKAYKKAPYEIKRLYLSFFWDKFLVKDRKIVKAKPTELIEVLLRNNKIFAKKLQKQRSFKGDFLLRPNLLRWQDSNL